MITVNWSRLVLCMAIFALISIPAETFLNIHFTSAFVAGVGVFVGLICVRRNTQKE